MWRIVSVYVKTKQNTRWISLTCMELRFRLFASNFPRQSRIFHHKDRGNGRYKPVNLTLGIRVVSLSSGNNLTAGKEIVHLAFGKNLTLG